MAKMIRVGALVSILIFAVYLFWPKRAEVSAPALDRLNKASEKSWTPVLDTPSGHLKILKNGALNVSGSVIEEKSAEFLKQYSRDLFSVRTEDLFFDRLVKADRDKAVFGQKVAGLRVYGATVTLVYEDKILMRVQNDLSDLKPEADGAPLSIGEIESRLRKQGTDFLKNKRIVSTELIYYPTDDRLVKAYQMIVDVRKDGSRGEGLLLVVNARDASVILSRDLRAP